MANRNMEEWKDVPGFSGLYMVSNFGRIKSISRKCNCIGGKRTVPEKIRKPSAWCGDKRLGIRLSKNGKKHFYYVHQLVAMAFLGHDTNEYAVVDHINENPKDNRLENLQIITYRENTAKSIINKGSKTSKYTGVSWSNKEQKWRSQAVIYGVKKHLGFFNNEYDAYIAYRKAIENVK